MRIFWVLALASGRSSFAGLLPSGRKNWSQGMYGGAYYPDATAKFLADLVNASPYKNDFYVWYAVGTEDVRLDQTVEVCNYLRAGTRRNAMQKGVNIINGRKIITK